MDNYELLITAALGLAVLFFGYRIKKIAFFLVWFILGFNLMNFLLPTINANVPVIATSQLYQLLLPIAGGVLMGLLGFTIEKICVSGIFFCLVMLITVQYFGTDYLTLIVGAVLGAISGALAVRLMKPAIILATAIAGGYAITVALLALIPELNKEVLYWPLIAGLALLGTLFQFKSTKSLA